MSRRGGGLRADPYALIAVRTGVLAILAGLAGYALNLERSRTTRGSLRGVPLVVAVLLVLVVVWTYLLNPTSCGRHIYAVGGNAEAARRAGINVTRIRISCFVLCSFIAGGGRALAPPPA